MSISQELIEYSARLARARIARLPRGTYAFVDYLDDDGISPEPLPIRVSVRIDDEGMRFDFSGTSPQVTGSLNAPAAVARSAVYYVLRCIVGGDVPANDGTLLIGNHRRSAALAARPRIAAAGGRRQRRDLAARRGRGLGSPRAGAARIGAGGRPGNDEQHHPGRV